MFLNFFLRIWQSLRAFLTEKAEWITGSRERREINLLKKNMKKSINFEQWSEYANQFDQLPSIQRWRKNPKSGSYDYKYILQLTNLMKKSRLANDFEKIIHLIRSHSFRNIGNILNPKLYQKAYLLTKTTIEEFLKELEQCLLFIENQNESILCQESKIEFFSESRHAVGRSALMLSGGATLGLIHLGVIKVLFQLNLLPQILAGSSAGSVIASFICTKTDEELKDFFSDPNSIKLDSVKKSKNLGSLFSRLKSLFLNGYLVENKRIIDFLQENIGDVTFREAFDKTGKVLNISVTAQNKHEQDRVLNYLTSPNVLIWSAVCASCAFPYLICQPTIVCKDTNGNIVEYIEGQKYMDGSIGADIPMAKVAEFFNVNCFIVSQVNPLYISVIPFTNHSEYMREYNWILRRWIKLFEWIKDIILLEIKFRTLQLGQIGLLPQIIKKYANLISQEYSGNITIFPAPKIMDYLTLTNDPTEEMINNYNLRGQKRTFLRISQIRAMTFFENSLNRIYDKLQKSTNKPFSFQPISRNASQKTISPFDEIEEQKIFSKKKKCLFRNFGFSLPRSKSREYLRAYSTQNLE